MNDGGGDISARRNFVAVFERTSAQRLSMSLARQQPRKACTSVLRQVGQLRYLSVCHCLDVGGVVIVKTSTSSSVDSHSAQEAHARSSFLSTHLLRSEITLVSINASRSIIALSGEKKRVLYCIETKHSKKKIDRKCL